MMELSGSKSSESPNFFRIAFRSLFFTIWLMAILDVFVSDSRGIIWPLYGILRVESTPSGNRLELTGMHAWLFFIMAGLRNGIFVSTLTPPRIPIWRPKNGNKYRFMLKVHNTSVAQLLWHIGTTFQRIPSYFLGLATQWHYCENCPMYQEVGNPRWQSPNRKYLYLSF